MKKIILIAALILGSTAYINNAAAQVKINVNVNIGSQPSWGPAGYDYVQYYYMPDINVYYHVPTRQYVYLNRGRWIFAASLPVSCRNYDVYRGYKVVVNEPKAYLHNNVHKVTYVKYKGYKGRQVIIRDSKDPKYIVVNKGNDNGHANGHNKHDDRK